RVTIVGDPDRSGVGPASQGRPTDRCQVGLRGPAGSTPTGPHATTSQLGQSVSTTNTPAARPNPTRSRSTGPAHRWDPARAAPRRAQPNSRPVGPSTDDPTRTPGHSSDARRATRGYGCRHVHRSSAGSRPPDAPELSGA